MFKDFKPADYENVRHVSNEAQSALTSELVDMMSSGSAKDVNTLNRLIESYKKISESSTVNINSQDIIKTLVQEFIGTYENNGSVKELASIWNETKQELGKVVIESNKIAYLIEQSNNQRNSLDQSLPNIVCC